MTSINSLMSSTSTSSSTSIYGNRNVISGLASGLDTETMIENAVSGYKTKITSLQQQQEQVQWKQEAYRSIIDKMVSMTRKYTSYTSTTNLFSQTFFNSAVFAIGNGANADKVTASGKSSSDVQINGIKQLAQAARRTTSIGNTALAGATASTNKDGRLEINGGAIDLSGTTTVSKMSGGMTLTYGASGNSVYLDFGELETFTETTDENGNTVSAAQNLADAINKKLSETQVKTGAGSYVTASDRIEAVADENGNITFTDKANAGNSIYISGASDNIQKTLGITPGENATSIKGVNDKTLTEDLDTAEYLSDKTISFTLDGVTKTVSLGKLTADTDINDLKQTIQDSLNKQFGTGKVGVSVNADGGFSFDIANGSTLQVTSEVGEALGLGKNGMTSYLDTSKTLGELGDEVKGLFDGTSKQEASVNLSDLIKLSGEKITVGGVEINLGEIEYTAKAEDVAAKINAQLQAANSKVTVAADGSTKLLFSADADTNFTISSSNTEKADIYTQSKKMQELVVNGTSVGKFSEDDTLTSVMNAINNSDTGVKISYSKLTNEFSMVAKDTGAQSEVSMSGNLAKLFGLNGDGDVFDRFDSDGLDILGIDPNSVTATKDDNGNVSWTDADGKVVAQKVKGDDGVTRLQKLVTADDGTESWLTVMSKSADGNMLQSLDKNGNLVDAYRKVAKEDGSVSIQKAVGTDNNNTVWNTVGSQTQGQDAIFDVTVNGSSMQLTRSTNTVDLDGLSVTFKETFGEYDKVTDDKGNVSYKFNTEANKETAPITFTTGSDVTKITDAIRAFVEDYNALVTEIHNAYSTMPNEVSSSDHSRYLPLTDEDKSTMSESAIAAYEEKAKQGILFGSTELSSLYRQLTSVIQNSSLDTDSLKAIGITMNYSSGLTTLELDENALADALEKDPDKVRDTFAKSVENGASSNGLMYNMKSVLDSYASTSSASTGILIMQAGSSYAPSSINSNYLQTQYDEYTKQIEKWQTKMSDKVDYYTKQFTALEQLIATMNNQSSMLAGLQGGY